MSKNKLKSFAIDSFEGGINASFLKTMIADNELYDGLNMFYENGRLVTRKGIEAIGSKSLSDDATEFDVTPVGPIVYTDKNAMKMFFVSRNASGTFCNKLLIVNTDREIYYLSLIDCDSSIYENGIQRVNCIAFNGKEVNGSGIFVILSLIDSAGEVCDKFIFELNKEMSRASLVSVANIYAPLVYANGRGASYADLPVSKRTFPSPKVLEDFNALSSGFKAAYTTDGVSSYFYLPTKNLSSEINENIIISYTDVDGNDYSWVIAYNATSSDYIEIGGVKTGFTVNRKIGRIFLHDNTGAAVVFPMSEGIYNNLVIKAYKTPEDKRLFKMTVSENFNSRIFLSGNYDEGNVVCFSKQNNPLYFPKSNIAYFGDKTGNITAARQLNDRLVIFKAHQTGICSSVTSTEYDIESVLEGKAAKNIGKESMQIKTINTGIGCVYPDTIINCANRLVFLGSDNRVYTVTSTSNYLQRFYRISDKIESKFAMSSVDENIYAMDYEGKYMLFVDNKCYVFDYNTSAFLSATAYGSKKQKDNIGWFYAEYNFGIARPFFAMCVGGSVVITAKINAQNATTDIVLFYFNGTKDQKLISSTESEFVEIESSFTTKASSFSVDADKKIVGIELCFASELLKTSHPIDISYLDENKSAFIKSSLPVYQGDENEVVMKITPCVFGVRYFGINLRRASAFALKRIKFIYKTS